jgi:transcriptional regulator with XRE-family HTH domain
MNQVYHFGSNPVLVDISGGISGNTLDSPGTRCKSRHITCLRYRTQVYGAGSGNRPHDKTMATMMAPISAMEVQSQTESTEREVPQREVLRCEACKLVQFRTASDTCRRCKKSLLPEIPKAQPAIALVAEPTPSNHEGGPQVATAVRDLRHVRNLSQRQLAARMGVPRTYISKIENGKAMPTLSSLDRLARALQVDISALLRDAPTRHRDESAVLLTDPFLAEIAKYSAHLTATQKSIFLNHVRELSQNHNRRMA